MNQILKINIFFIIIILSSFISAFAEENEPNNIISSDIVNIDPFAFNVNELAGLNLLDIKNQAVMHMLEKNYEAAAKSYLFLLKHNIDDAASYYELAKCYAFLGKEQYAADFLIMAINYGFNNFTKIKEEKAFQYLLKSPSFSKSYNEVLESGGNLGDNIYVKAEKLMKCRVLLPENYDENKAYPLLIGMHGFGGSSESFVQLWRLLDTHSYILVIPEAPYSAAPDSYIYSNRFSWDIRVNKEYYKFSDHLISDFMVDVKKYMCSKYKIDKAYIIGFSQGGSHTYVAGIKNPDVFEGIICFGAIMPDPQKFSWFLSEENIENGSDLRVFIAHGKSDPYPYKNAIKARRKLQKYKYDVEQHLFDGGHMIDPTTFLKALNWMGIQ